MARGLIARAWLGAREIERHLGGFTLRPSQVRAVRQIELALEAFGGALLADPPGTGKTVIALAVARESAGALVVAPAGLRTLWQEAAHRAGVPIAFVSFEALSRGHRPPRAPLIVVDEAHHVRTPGTVRYRQLAASCAGARVLLLSATPVVNRRADRDALLALFLGARSALLGANDLTRCIIRRDRDDAPQPLVRRLPPLAVDLVVPGLADALKLLPPPMPLADGSTATALIRMSLALAWQSSLAALDAALRRRVQRGEALGDLLRAGRTPSRAALRHWALGDDHTQLVLAELVAPEGRAAPGDERALAAHLDAVRAMRSLLGDRIRADARARATCLLALAATHPTERIVVFARHAETIRALHAELRLAPGVVAVTGSSVRAAAGRWSRAEVLDAIGPRARPLDARDPRVIRILLATDLLSEGVEMQGVSLIVHADLPWTPARIAQRRGRLTRVGSTAREILETRFAAPLAARPLLHLSARLARKRRAARNSLRLAAARGQLEALMSEWAADPSTVRVESVVSSIRGFVAAMRIGQEVHLVCARKSAGGWRLATSAAKRLDTCAAAGTDPAPLERGSVTEARRVLRRFLRHRVGGKLIGDRSSPPGDPVRRLLARLEHLLVTAGPTRRVEFAILHRRLLNRLGDRTEAGLEADLRALLHTGDDLGLVDRLHDLLDRVRPVVPRIEGPAAPECGPRRAQVIALLLLTPSNPHEREAAPTSPTSVAPGTVAPR